MKGSNISLPTFYYGPGRSRTADLLLRRQPLYPTELLGQTQSRAGDLPLSFLLRQVGERHDRIAAYLRM